MKLWKEIKDWKKRNGWLIDPSTDCEWARIGEQARISEWASIGERASICKGSIICKGAIIGERASIGEQASIGEWARIGEGARISEGVRIGERASIGEVVTVPVYRFRQYSMNWHSVGNIRSGCIVKPFGWWQSDDAVRCAEKHGYDKREQIVYQQFVRQIIEWEGYMGDSLGVVETEHAAS